MTKYEIETMFAHPSVARQDALLRAELEAYEADLTDAIFEDAEDKEQTIAQLVATHRSVVSGQYNSRKIYDLYAYFEAPVAFLDTEIPNGAPDWYKEVTDPDTGEIEQVAKTLREYSNEIRISSDGTTALIKCQARQADCGRLTPATVANIELWIQYLGAYGYAEDSLFGLDKRKELLESEAYNGNTRSA